MDEEAQKRNTDCVYFLASPLTCKKGINCEFRHSEAARLHPRDCRYWLGGNCLNANCPFRHPPLDGKPASVSALAPASAAPSKAASVPSISATLSSIPASKPKTPCYFFSQGYCSKGDRCTYLHAPVLSTSAQAAVFQKPPTAPTCKGVETKDKPLNMNGPTVQKHRFEGSKTGAGMTPVHTLPSNVFIRAQEAPHVNNDAPRERISEGSRALSSKHQSVHAPNMKIRKPADLHNREQTVEQRQQQRQGTDDHRVELIRSGEARQQQSFSQEERTQNGTLRDGLLKEASPGFVGDEFDNSTYREDNRCSPFILASTHSPRRTNFRNGTHDFGQKEQDGLRFNGTHLLPKHDSYDQLYEYDCQQADPESRGRHDSPPYYARKDRHRIKGDLRDRLVKRRNCVQDQFSDINGNGGVFQDRDDYAHFDERGWDDSFEWAPSPSEGDKHLRRLGRADRRSIQSPNYDFREGDNAFRSFSGGSHMRFLVGDCPRSKLINSEGGWYGSRRARRFSELEVSNLGAQSRSAHTRLESPINSDDCFQALGSGTLRSEIHSSFVARPSIKSRILPASSSNVGEVDLKGSTLSSDFEGPKPLSVLLQKKRKAEEDGGGAERV